MENSSKRIHKDAKVVECKLMQHMGNVLSRLIITNIIYIPTHPQFRNHFCSSCPITPSSQVIFSRSCTVYSVDPTIIIYRLFHRDLSLKFISFHSKLTNRITITERYRCRASKQSAIRFIEITSYNKGEGRKEGRNKSPTPNKED